MAPMIDTQNHYAVLRVRTDATQGQIKAAYRRLALQHHPDKNDDSLRATTKIQKINAAWEILGDPSKRRQYDQTYLANGELTKEEEAENRRQDQEWQVWVTHQEACIRACGLRVQNLEAEISAFEAEISTHRALLGRDIPYWWNILAVWTKRLSETEKNDLRHEILAKDAEVRARQSPLKMDRLQLVGLKEELSRRRTRETQRSAIVQQKKKQREELAKEKAKAEAKRQQEKKRRAATKARWWAHMIYIQSEPWWMNLPPDELEKARAEYPGLTSIPGEYVDSSESSSEC